MPRYLQLFIACLVTLVTAAAQNAIPVVPSRVLGLIDESQRITLKGNVHPMALRQLDQGAAPGSTPTGRIRLVLQRGEAQQRALTQYLSDLQNPGSPAYHKWITPAQYGATYGISESDLLRVQSWLQSHGFKITRVPQAHNVIEFSGTLDQIESAFHTVIHSFLANGETHFANVGDPQIPATLAPVLAGVGPLNDFHAKPMLVRGPNGQFDPSTGRITPSLTLSGNGATYLFVDPADAAIIYDTPNNKLNPRYSGTNYDGTGVAVGIVGVSDLVSADVANYRVAFLGETTSSVNLPTVVVDGNDPGVNGAAVEALLDTEVAGGIAPNARIYFYTSADTDLSSGLVNAIFRALDDNTVSILSISFSNCEAATGTTGNQMLLEASEQAAAQGITLTVSSGDNGSAGCDDFNTESQATKGFGVNALASTPYTIAVGGTDFDVLSTSLASYVNNTSSGIPPYYATALKYIPENPWNDSTTVNTTYSNNVAYRNSSGNGNIVAASGGTSSVYTKPSFQSSLTPQDGFRDLPDVSFLAGDGMYNAAWLICSDNVTDGVTSQTYTDCLTTGGSFTSNSVFGGAGGTSAAAPAFAGILALVAQAHGSPSDNYRLGQADNVLYQLAQSKYLTVFHDVTTGNNSVPCTAGSLNCGSNLFLTGYNAGNRYDLASGLGSVDAAALVSNWTSVSLESTTTSLKINGSAAAYTGVHGQALRFDVSLVPSTASGVVGIVDNASETNGGIQNNGQFAIPISGGVGSASYNGLPGGSYTAWARYGGDTGNASSTSTPPIDVTITPEASSTTLSIHAFDSVTGKPISTTNIPYGSYVSADAAITGTAEGSNTQGVATGTISFTDGANTLGSATVSSENQASWPAFTSNIPILNGGSHSLVASYSGDPSFNPSASQPVALTIVPAATSFFMDQPSYSLTSSQSASVVFELNTNWNPGMGPTGTVSLVENNQVIGSTSNFILSKGSIGSSLSESVTGIIPIQASEFPTGLNTVTVAYSGDSNYAPSSTTITVDAIAPGGGLSLTTPNNITLSPRTSVTSTVTLTPLGGYTGYVDLGCYVIPSPNSLSCWIPQTHVPLSDPVDTLLLVSGTASTATGTYTVNIRGGDNSGRNITKTISLTVGSTASPSLAVMNNGPFAVTAGTTTANTSNVSIIPSEGLTGQVNLSCAVMTALSNPQSLPTCSVPSSITLNGTMPIVAQVQVNTTSATTTGSYSVAVTGTSAAASTVTTTDMVPLTVTASPSFSLASSGIATVHAGDASAIAASVTITSLNGFSGPVNLACLVAPTFYATGIVASCSAPSSVQLSSGGSATVNVSLEPDARADTGLYLLTVSAVDPHSTYLGMDASADLVLIGPASFALSNNGNIKVSAGATSGNTASISLTPENGFTGTVNITCSVTADSLNPNHFPGCSLSPATLNVTSATTLTSTLTVSTTAPTSGALVPRPEPFRIGGLTAVLALLFVFGIPSKRRVWMSIVGSIVLFICVGALGCGGGGGSGSGGNGGGGSSGTTPGSYSVNVTATDAATGKIKAETTVNLTVT